MYRKPLILLIGKSGSGKSTVAKHLSHIYGLRVLESYTTRPRREPNEEGHIFVTKEEYTTLQNKVAETYFDDNYYCATKEQIDNADIYIIDPDGYFTLQKNYKSDRRIIPIYLKVSSIKCYHRMIARGDTEEQASTRIKHDRARFGEILSYIDCIELTNTGNVEDVCNIIMKLCLSDEVLKKLCKNGRLSLQSDT